MGIVIAVEKFKGVRLVIGNLMTNTFTGELILAGKTIHCFADVDGKSIILKKRFSEIDGLLRNLMSNE